jgi:hypothetical protein
VQQKIAPVRQSCFIHLGEFDTSDLPFDFSFTKGNSDFSLWTTWRASQMTDMQGDTIVAGAFVI